MTIKEARRLTVGDVVYRDIYLPGQPLKQAKGIVIGIKADSCRIQFKNEPAINFAHDQMTIIHRTP